MNRFNKRFFYICLFGILYAITAFSSFWHAVEFFELSNIWWMGIILALAFEIGQAAVLLSILTSSKERSKITPWILMGILTLVQIIGNVYSSYKYIMINSPENLKYFKEPIFIWTDLPDAEATVIITYISSAILPITALLLTSMITNYLTDQSAENNSPIFVPEITSENVTNTPTEIKDELDCPPEGEGLSEQQEIENLNATIDNRDEEIDNLKKKLEKLKNDKENTQQKLLKSNVGLAETTEDNTTTEDKSDNDNVEQSEDTDKNQVETESSVTEDLNSENNEVHNIEDERNIIDSNEQRVKPSHFINLN